MKNLKSIVLIFISMFVFCLAFGAQSNVWAANDNETQYISLSDSLITVNGEKISTNVNDEVYLSKTTNNGGSSIEALEANEDVENVINITKNGIYEFIGSLADGQIAVNSNEIDGEVVIVLNNVNITCENAPAIFIYNKEMNPDNCSVIIKTGDESKNVLTASRLKADVQGWLNQDSLLYYVEKGYEDDGTYYEEYKYNGVISSDVSLTFEGEGSLEVVSTKKEGIEVKGDITFNSGDYVIKAQDDGINASEDGKSAVVINGGSLYINVEKGAEEGDAIDSNGSLTINGGTVYAFASEVSGDSGLDSDLGITINGGYVVATGNMYDSISQNSKQKFATAQFTDIIAEGTLLTITDENNNPIAAFENEKAYKVLVISTPNMGAEFSIYEGGRVDGVSANGFYTNIASYQLGILKEYNGNNFGGFNKGMNAGTKNFAVVPNGNSNLYFYVLIVLAVVLVVLIVIALILKKKGYFASKGKVLMLIIGIVIGALLATGGFMIYNNVMMQSFKNRNQMNGGQFNRDQMMQNGERPELPNGETLGGMIESGGMDKGTNVNSGKVNI